MERKIGAALISVFYKDGLEPIVRKLHELGVTIYSTGGTQSFIEQAGIPCVSVESVTGYSERGMGFFQQPGQPG